MALAVLFSLLCLSLSQLLSFQANAQQNPTSGFTAVPLSQSNFKLQKPYDKSPSERYSFSNGEHRLWVFATDKPHTTSSDTKPRTEIAIRGYDYSSGVWQFEGQAYVPSGTTGTSIMQVFGGSSRATTIMLRVYTGSLTVYRSPVYIDGVLKSEGLGAGGNNHNFKFGVYAQNDESNYMESRWRGIRVLRRN
ncbi:Alginate lyase 2 - like 2 [Theobroma cacao]|nr:Alginate lyase 2 - like 2 [Theobroma cacao]